MKFRVLTQAHLPERVLYVAAGSVTCANVHAMLGGFKAFKKIFANDEAYEGENGWKYDLEQKLNAFHKKKITEEKIAAPSKPMPPYMTIARNRERLGGVATVPVLGEYGHHGLSKYWDGTLLTLDQESSPEDPVPENKNDFPEPVNDTKTHVNPRQKKLLPAPEDTMPGYIEEYKTALRQTFQEAIDLDIPVIIQPLGTGGYGWPANIAAEIFADVLEEFKDTNLDVTVNIHSTDPNDVFKNQLLQKVAIEKETPLIDYPKGASDKDIFINMVNILITNIESGVNRKTSRNSEAKCNALRNIIKKLEQEAEDIGTVDYTKQIFTECNKHRNAISGIFSASPTSVNEFAKLLQANNFDNQGKDTLNQDVIIPNHQRN